MNMVLEILLGDYAISKTIFLQWYLNGWKENVQKKTSKTLDLQLH